MKSSTLKWLWAVMIFIIIVFIGVVVVLPRISVIERTEVRPQPPSVELQLTDDELEDKNPAFDETLVDSRPLGDWQVNLSDAVIKLNCPDARSDTDAELLVLRPTYRDAMRVAKESGHVLLPSANLVDGAAKQFDDGLYACIDLACYQGRLGPGPSAPALVRAIFDRLTPDSPARPFLAAALHVAKQDVELTPAETNAMRRFLDLFESDRERSKPIGFYTWTPELEEVWRFYRFLQFEFDIDLTIPRSVAQVLEGDPTLLEQYRALNAFYGRLTNPLICLPVDALIGNNTRLSELAGKYGARRQAVCVFPPSTSRETELFDRMFRDGLPPNVNLMAELIRRIRSGEVDLKPGDNDGWYQYQVYALETMLLPGKGQEAEKLLLMATYKKRFVEAFKALITKRRETHVRQLSAAKSEAVAEGPRPFDSIKPRLRVEPCATFYLRTARAYAFLHDFLLATVGEDTLKTLHGFREGGAREANLFDELASIRQRFYGLYLVACEDIGMKPAFLDGETVDETAAKEAALAWLGHLEDDADLACDTRVCIPIFREEIRNATRLWGTLGVRLAPLDASYARPPRVRPLAGGGPWEPVEEYKLEDSHYVIPVDEFAEFELEGLTSLTRAEFRAICDEHMTKEEIIKALAKR